MSTSKRKKTTAIVFENELDAKLQARELAASAESADVDEESDESILADGAHVYSPQALHSLYTWHVRKFSSFDALSNSAQLVYSALARALNATLRVLCQEQGLTLESIQGMSLQVEEGEHTSTWYFNALISNTIVPFSLPVSNELAKELLVTKESERLSA